LKLKNLVAEHAEQTATLEAQLQAIRDAGRLPAAEAQKQKRQP
jgi:hypothetical protein